MTAALFISDLHLCESRPETTALFRRFLAGPARQADALYILGDLFEHWVGDDCLALPFHREMADAIGELGAAGTEVFLMHGNRDFLLGQRFAAQSGASLIMDPHVLSADGGPVLLLHGDTLCTDDVAYQRFRQTVRAPDWQASFLAQPLDARLALAGDLRRQSEAQKGAKAEAIMDVNDAAVARAFQAHGVRRMIHGHTHRPGRHDSTVDGVRRERWVLPDWYGDGGYLRLDADGISPRRP